MMRDGAKEYWLTEADRLCFIHIPKTAGTTFTYILEARFDQHEVCPVPHWLVLKEMAPSDLAQYRLFRGHFPHDVVDFLPTRPICVTMFRDPVERVISAYEFMKTCIIVMPKAAIVQQKALTLSLKDYVRDPDVTGVVNAQTRQVAGRGGRRGSYVLTDPRWLDSAIENLQSFAFFGLTERFWESMALLCYRFGWPPLFEIQNLMVGSKRLRRDGLTPDVVEAIEEHNQLDLQLYELVRSQFDLEYRQMVQDLQSRYGDPTQSLDDPVPPELLKQWLERHYEARYAAVGRSPLSTLTFHFHQALPGTGWHGLEGEGLDNPFRWTGPGTQSNLDLCLTTDRDLMFEIRIRNAISTAVLHSLVVYANDRLIHLIALHQDDHGAVLRGVVPQEFLVSDRPFTRFTIHVSQTLPLKLINLDVNDHRKVGLAIDLVQVFPRNASPAVKTVPHEFDTPPWESVINFLNQHVKPNQKIFAPNRFYLLFPDRMPSLDAIPTVANNYSATQVDTTEFQWVVIHKGMMDEIWDMLVQLAVSEFSPVFANEVFLVFANQPNLPTLHYGRHHVRSAYTNTIRHQLAQRTQDAKELIHHAVVLRNRQWRAKVNQTWIVQFVRSFIQSRKHPR
ncbi:MAG: sulfotransferase family 2 domain-containing protein [Synechococcales bacterium]|nr:sulfotransferase family 2 domain-containing protein [Synechococcales bacterium]